MRLLTFAILQLGVIAIAATLWIEMRRAERRSRLVKNVESIISDGDFRPEGEIRLKRVA
ncbi:MAG TPA: hypothetical protein VMB03_03960 [Bryobacteraceae bacterium]|nr:hypothetical protein [Bryobacteraceae bacterium]